MLCVTSVITVSLRCTLILWQLASSNKKSTFGLNSNRVSSFLHKMLCFEFARSGFRKQPDWPFLMTLASSPVLWYQLKTAEIALKASVSRGIAPTNMSPVMFGYLIHKLLHAKQTHCACVKRPPLRNFYFISLVSSCVGIWEEEPETAFPMSTWVSQPLTCLHGVKLYPVNPSYIIITRNKQLLFEIKK